MSKWLPVLLLLSACATTTPKVQYYLLNFEGRSQVAVKPALTVANITVAEYLGQRGIALRTDNHSVTHAQYHRWGEPLQAGIRRTVEHAIAAHTQALPQSRLDMHIDHLYGTPHGEVKLLAHWQADVARCTISGVIDAELVQSEAGYAALVATQKALLLQSMETVLNDLQQRLSAC